MTNKEHRPEFLQCLQEMRNRSVPVSFNGFCGDDGTMPRWISVRQIHVKTFSLFGFDKEFIEDLHLPSLQKLEVLSPPWLRHVPQLSPLLEELSIGQFSTRAIMEDLVFVLSQCSELKSVCIDILSFESRDGADEVLAELQEYGHLITEIRLLYGNKTKKTIKNVKNFIDGCSSLKKLGCRDFEDNGKLLKCVAQSCPLLEDISFDTWSHPALLELSRNCKQLRKVQICAADQDIVTKPSDLEVLKQIDTLEELHMWDCGLTDETLAVISGFRHLKRLRIEEDYGIDGLTGAGFRVLSGSPISESLQNISFDLWESFWDSIPVQDFDKAEMIAGIASCHNLRNVDLSFRCACDDAGLMVLGAGCPLLEEIQVEYEPVTADGLAALAELCQHLTKVVLEYDYSSPTRAQAAAEIATVRSRLPDIQFVCNDKWDEGAGDGDIDDIDDVDDDDDDDDA